jgi:DNA polymerase III delta prime subunit
MVRAASKVAVLGREHEREHLVQFLGEIPHGPAILLIEGEAGIGKTTLWELGVEEALDHPQGPSGGRGQPFFALEVARELARRGGAGGGGGPAHS